MTCRSSTDRVKAGITKEEINHVNEQLRRSRERFDELTIRSSAEGHFSFRPMAPDLPGRFVKRGELLGYVLDRSTITARVVVSQADVDFVRQQDPRASRFAFPRRSPRSSSAIKREIPAATDQLPSPTLGQQGGGEIAIDPRDTQGTEGLSEDLPVRYRNAGDRPTSITWAGACTCALIMGGNRPSGAGTELASRCS